MDIKGVDVLMENNATVASGWEYQFNWKPRYNNDKDNELREQLLELQEHLQLKKSELVRKALTDFVHANADFTICMQCGQEQTTSEQWRSEIR